MAWLFALVVFLIVLSFACFHYRTHISGFLRSFEHELVALGTVFIAAFTVILAVATGLLYFATRDLVHETEAHGQRSLRA